LFERVVAKTAAWAIREMRSPEGGFYCALDADSEHEEGRYYVWTPQQIRELLSPEELAVVEPHYGLDGPPNFEGRHWHLRVVKPLGFVARRLGIEPAECEARLVRARAKLLAARERRVRPGRDEKVLASWNGLMIRGLARAGRAFGDSRWIGAAQQACDFVRSRLWREGRLRAVYKDGEARLNAYLDDHAFLLDGLLELLQAEFRAEDLEFARALAELLIEKFEDREHGGFFFVSHDHERLIHRTKPGQDGATPSGNGIAAFALQRLGYLLGEPRYLEAAGRALELFYPLMERQPSAFVSLGCALEERLSPPTTVVLRGAPEELARWQRAAAGRYRPAVLVFAIGREATGLHAALDHPVPASGASAFVCRGTTCLPPVHDLRELERLLEEEAR
ncbi:MAG: thioredoxin domain-containing protein, partial [Dehalococcoidia bacterium]|nr:thioredoxin domain-containing protein [Dehalococcoidia bacterium]